MSLCVKVNLLIQFICEKLTDQYSNFDTFGHKAVIPTTGKFCFSNVTILYISPKCFEILKINPQ